MTVKTSVSLPEEDIDFLDLYVQSTATSNRSSAIHEAIRQLRLVFLEQEYAKADEEWESSEDQRLWDNTLGDGIEAGAA